MAIDRQSDTQIAYGQIRARILDGRLAPGHPLSPRNMADELTLGHMPIRTAIQRLVVEGLVEVIPRKGTYVSAPTTTDLSEIFEIRLALESTAAYLAALNGITEGLTKTVAQMRRLVETKSTDLMLEQQIGCMFHEEVFAAARNERLFSSYKMLCVQTGLVLNGSGRDDASTVRRGTLEHLNVYIAIKFNDAEAARRYMWNHIIDSNEKTKTLRGQHEYST